jgi:hypothetical protein
VWQKDVLQRHVQKVLYRIRQSIVGPHGAAHRMSLWRTNRVARLMPQALHRMAGESENGTGTGSSPAESSQETEKQGGINDSEITRSIERQRTDLRRPNMSSAQYGISA